MEDVLLKIENISKKYGKKTILNDINFEVKRGEFLSILGASGCGKTTLLKILIGIEDPDCGSITKDGVDIIKLSPLKRNIGIVFQNYALFPNMNVYQNIAYALKQRKLEKNEIEERVKKIIDMVDLSDHIYKKPRQLSGGQQQRVAIARTLVLKPDIILFDEPMSALDANIKTVLRKLLKDIQEKAKVTMIYVTHDQEEAFALSHRIMVINDNKIAQLDTPANLYNKPNSDFIEHFVVKQIDDKIKLLEESIR